MVASEEEDCGIRWRVPSLAKMAEKEHLWDVARQANMALEKAIEKAAGVDWQTFEQAYHLATNEAARKPWEQTYDGLLHSGHLCTIVAETVQRARLEDIVYNDSEEEPAQLCPLCGSSSIQTCDDDYAEFFCSACSSKFEDPISGPNSCISGSALLREFFADYHRIHG